jgi:hypothetical protein
LEEVSSQMDGGLIDSIFGTYEFALYNANYELVGAMAFDR